MDNSENLVLSGRTFIARIPFASPEVLRTAIGDGAMMDDRRQPMQGDLRLSASISAEGRGTAAGVACAGVVTASIYDGWCWQRFEIASLTSMYKFVSEVQLRGVLGWANRANHDAAGRACRRSLGVNGFPVYELVAVAPPAAPATSVAPSPVVATKRGGKASAN